MQEICRVRRRDDEDIEVRFVTDDGVGWRALYCEHDRCCLAYEGDERPLSRRGAVAVGLVVIQRMSGQADEVYLTPTEDDGPDSIFELRSCELPEVDIVYFEPEGAAARDRRDMRVGQHGTSKDIS